MATYSEAKAARAAIESELMRFGAILESFPKGPMGLTPDAVKASPEYRTARASYDAAFRRLQNTNAHFIKAFAMEIRADRRSRRNAQTAHPHA